eukprot:1145242-Pelagomonas_calceolata.AAC.4
MISTFRFIHPETVRRSFLTYLSLGPFRKNKVWWLSIIAADGEIKPPETDVVTGSSFVAMRWSIKMFASRMTSFLN